MEGRSLEIVDASMEDTYNLSEALRAERLRLVALMIYSNFSDFVTSFVYRFRDFRS